MSGNKSKPLVVGLGNEFRGDDAIGIKLIQLLSASHSALADFMIESSDATRLLESWDGRDLILIDAIMTEQASAGKIHTFDSLDALFKNDEILFTTHSIDLSTVLELGLLLKKTPKSFFFIGVEGSEWGIGAEISPTLTMKIPELIKIISDQIKQIQT